LGLQLSLRMMSTWLLSPQRLKVDTPDAMYVSLRQHWGLRSIDSCDLHEVNTKLGRTLGLTIIVTHDVDLVAQSPAT